MDGVESMDEISSNDISNGNTLFSPLNWRYISLHKGRLCLKLDLDSLEIPELLQIIKLSSPKNIRIFLKVIRPSQNN